MSDDLKSLVREGFGAIADELRQRRAADAEILKRLDVLIKMAGGNDAKTTAIREDLDAHIGDRLRHAIAR